MAWWCMLFTRSGAVPTRASSREPEATVTVMRQVVAGVAGGGEVVVLDRVGALRRDVLVERAAQRHVQDLEAAAEAEQRLALVDAPSGRT